MTDKAAVTAVLQESVLVVCRMPGTSGTVQIPREKVPDPLRSKIPENLLTMTAHLADKEALRGLSTLRAQVSRELDPLGTRFPLLEAHLLPKANLSVAAEVLDRAEVAYNAWVSPALDRLEASIGRKLAEYPEFAEALRAAAPTRAELEARMRFRRGIVTLGMVTAESGQAVPAGLENEIMSLPMQVAREISQDVDENWSEIVLKPDAKVAQRFRSVIERVRAKAKSMSYIEPKLSTLVDVIDSTMKRLPAYGPLTGVHVVVAHGLRSLLRDPEAILGSQAVILPSEVQDELESGTLFSAGKGGRRAQETAASQQYNPFADAMADISMDAVHSRPEVAQTAAVPAIEPSPLPVPGADVPEFPTTQPVMPEEPQDFEFVA